MCLRLLITCALLLACGDDVPLDAGLRDSAPRDVTQTQDSQPQDSDTSDVFPGVDVRDIGSDARADVMLDAPLSDTFAEPGGFDVFILAGQSNMVGRGRGYDILLDAPHPEIWQWGRTGDEDGVIIPAVARLAHNDANLLNRVGMGLSFAKAYYEVQGSPRPILLVPTACGGTGYSDDMWNPGDPLFEDAIFRANAALASEPGNRLVGILWHQGERDVGGGYSAEQYADAFDVMLMQFRARISGAGDAPVVLGEFAPAWAPSTSTAAVLAAIHQTPERIPYAAIASSSGLSSNPGNDTVHFDAAGLRAYGPRYAEALLVARSRAP